MIMRLFERDLRADSSTSLAWLPTRITQASNFSVERRWAFSEVMGMLSIPNCRKHSDSRLREDSCKSTNAALAENFLVGDKGIIEFPKGFSVLLFGKRVMHASFFHGSELCATRLEPL